MSCNNIHLENDLCTIAENIVERARWYELLPGRCEFFEPVFDLDRHALAEEFAKEAMSKIKESAPHRVAYV